MYVEETSTSCTYTFCHSQNIWPQAQRSWYKERRKMDKMVSRKSTFAAHLLGQVDGGTGQREGRKEHSRMSMWSRRERWIRTERAVQFYGRTLGQLYSFCTLATRTTEGIASNDGGENAGERGSTNLHEKKKVRPPVWMVALGTTLKPHVRARS